MDPLLLVGIALGAGLSGGGLLVGLLWFHVARFLSYHRHKGLPAPTLSVRLAAREITAIAAIAWWHVRAVASDGLRIPPGDEDPPVLCIHGYSQNATNLWAIRKTLEAHGRSTIGISLWHRLAPMGWYAHRLEARLGHLGGALEGGFDVVRTSSTEETKVVFKHR